MDLKKTARLLVSIKRVAERPEVSPEARHLISGVCSDAASRMRRLTKLEMDRELTSGNLLHGNLLRSLLALISPLKHLPPRETRHLKPRLQREIAKLAADLPPRGPSAWENITDIRAHRIHDSGVDLDLYRDRNTGLWQGCIHRVTVATGEDSTSVRDAVDSVASDWLEPACHTLKLRHLLGSSA